MYEIIYLCFTWRGYISENIAYGRGVQLNAPAFNPYHTLRGGKISRKRMYYALT